MPIVFIQYRWFLLRVNVQDWIYGNKKAMLALMTYRLIIVVVMTHYATNIRQRFNLRTFNCICFASFIQYGISKPLFWPDLIPYFCCNTLLYCGALAVGSTVGFIRRGMCFLATRRPMDGLFALLHLGGILAVRLHLSFEGSVR
ncbi:hypothetical protein CDAR_19141 [Caerostris darwini]|uniref:Uncharacterized protein n=1 Tax=Caerostris darwini TaxID=1538125 RepID=A0AAV4WBM6_9ARAC|nr:hypothetical protein CDAR_19141 [Caerostris darwini]